MSHTYLIDLFDLIDQRLEEASGQLLSKNLDGAEAGFQQGRLDILMEIKQFLEKGYRRKLPRRIRDKY